MGICDHSSDVQVGLSLLLIFVLFLFVFYNQDILEESPALRIVQISIKVARPHA